MKRSNLIKILSIITFTTFIFTYFILNEILRKNHSFAQDSLNLSPITEIEKHGINSYVSRYLTILIPEIIEYSETHQDNVLMPHESDVLFINAYKQTPITLLPSKLRFYAQTYIEDLQYFQKEETKIFKESFNKKKKNDPIRNYSGPNRKTLSILMDFKHRTGISWEQLLDDALFYVNKKALDILRKDNELSTYLEGVESIEQISERKVLIKLIGVLDEISREEFEKSEVKDN